MLQLGIDVIPGLLATGIKCAQIVVAHDYPEYYCQIESKEHPQKHLYYVDHFIPLQFVNLEIFLVNLAPSDKNQAYIHGVFIVNCRQF